MEAKNILSISTRHELRQWFEANHASCSEFWIRLNRSKKAIDGILSYDDAVELALCFGWIDSTLKRLDEGKPFQRFSPRRNTSNWCERNIERVRRMIASGEMTQAGLEVFTAAARCASQSDSTC